MSADPLLSAPTDLEHRALAVDALVHTLEDAPDPGLRDIARDLVHALLGLHADGIGRMLELIEATGETGKGLLERFTSDPSICHLLLLHGLHPVDLETRIRHAINQARPLLTLHGGDVHLVGVEADGTVRLRLDGPWTAGATSRAAMTSAIADAIYEAAPDVMALHIEGPGTRTTPLIVSPGRGPEMTPDVPLGPRRA